MIGVVLGSGVWKMSENRKLERGVEGNAIVSEAVFMGLWVWKQSDVCM